MTEATERVSTLISEIESFLDLTAKRDMFTAGELQDWLLDLHNLATTPELN